jgi:hypothetical protein
MNSTKFKKDLFITLCIFLRDNKALERFCYNASVYHSINLPEDMRLGERTKLVFKRILFSSRIDLDYDRNYTSANFISRFQTAFDWDDTPEGFEFWEDISNRWKEYWDGKKYEIVRNI